MHSGNEPHWVRRHKGEISCRYCGHSWSWYKILEKGWHGIGHAADCKRDSP